MDIVGKNDDFTGYKLVIIPSLVHFQEENLQKVIKSGAQILAGPRTGIKNPDFQLPNELSLEGLGFQVRRVDALPRDLPVSVEWNGIKGNFSVWREHGLTSGVSEGKSSDGMAVLTSGNQGSYICGWPDQKLLNAIMKNQMQLAGLEVVELPEYLRVRRRGNLLFFTNYGTQKASIPEVYQGELLLGKRTLSQADISILKIN